MKQIFVLLPRKQKNTADPVHNSENKRIKKSKHSLKNLVKSMPGA